MDFRLQGNKSFLYFAYVPVRNSISIVIKDKEFTDLLIHEVYEMEDIQDLIDFLTLCKDKIETNNVKQLEYPESELDCIF